MKRFLSITLCVMMAASLFAVNVSAAIPTTYDTVSGGSDEIVYINQDYSNTATTADFTTMQYDGSIDATGGVLTMTAAYKTGTSAATISTTDIQSGSFVFEFDFQRNGEVAADYRLLVTFMRAANKADSTLQKYGVVIPVGTGKITKGTWYTYRLTVNEANSSDLANLVKVEYKAKDASAWTTIGHYGGWTLAAQETYKCRVVTGSNAISWGLTGGLWTGTFLGVQADPYAVTAFDSDTMDARNENFVFDNIKAYVPAVSGTVTSVNLPINTGIALTDLAETTKTTSGGTEYYFQSINWASEPGSIVATFDAKMTAGNGPLSMSVAGKEKKSAMTTIAPGTTGKWYSFKIVYDNTGSRNAATAIYRKAEDESSWTLLEKLADKAAVSDGQWCVGYNGSGSENLVRWYLYAKLTDTNATSNCESGTSWTVKNLQITDGSAFTGKAAVSGENLTVELNAELCSAADVIVAVYDGDKLANVNYAPVAITGNTATVTVPYEAGNTVKLYAWDALATGVPVLSTPITVNVN